MKSLEPTQETMSVDTAFDVASLTKCVATATSAMILYDQGRFRLNDPVSRYLPEFRGGGKDEVTIRQLLTHFSGLRPDLELKPDWEGKEEALRRIWTEKLVNPPGSVYVYSDINFETMGLLVEKLSGMPLEIFAQKNIYQPLGMVHTGFRPLAPPQGFQYATSDVDDRSDRIRRSHRTDVARGGTRPNGKADGRSGRPCGTLLDRWRSGDLCADAAGHAPRW